MATICAPGPFPSYSQIRSSVGGLFTSIDSSVKTSLAQAIARATILQPPIAIEIPDISITLPAMPGMPSFTWFETAAPGLQLEMFANQLQSFQQLSIMSAAYAVLSTVTSFPLPEIPGIPGATLDTLLALNPEQLLANITGGSGVRGLYEQLAWPEMEQLSTLQIRIAEYQAIMVNFLFDFANEVADILIVSKLSALPQIPNAQTIFAALSGPLSFPGFSIDLSVPDPLIPGFDFPEYEKGQILKMVMNSLPTVSLKTIVDFINDTLPGLTVPLALICLPVSVS